MKKNNFLLLRDIVVIWVAIISFSIFLIVNLTGIYHLFVINEHLAKQLAMTNYQLMVNYYHLINYLQSFWVDHWQTSIPCSSQGLQHFADVKRLIELNNVILLPFGGMAFAVLYQRAKRKQIWQLIMPFRALLTFLIIIFFVLIAAFDRIFIIFHEVLFRNRDWVFNPQTDPIIKVLPPDFFEICFLLAIGCWILLGGVIIIWGKLELKKDCDK